MTPGPTRVPERVLQAGARPMLHHRSPEFSAELATALRHLQPIFGTRNPVLPVHTTGRGALEAAICNLFSPGDEIVACCNGKFGEMWATLAESYGLVVHRVATDWARDVDPAEIDRVLATHRSVRAVTIAYCDTSTGVAADIETVSRIGAAHDVLTLVDGISSIGGMPFAFDAWNVDLAVVASQKCLMSSPGLSFAVLSDRAWRAVSRGRIPRSYWDFTAIRDIVTKERPETPGTAPVHLVLQVAEATRLIHAEGLAAFQARHDRTARHTRQRVADLGLTMQCPALSRFASVVTAIALPAGMAPKAVRDALKARGIFTGAGMGRFEPLGMRIGHMGDIREADVDRTLDALADVLAALGHE